MPGASPTAASNEIAGGSTASQVLGAQGLGDLLAKSTAATGVEVQQRNAVVVDPRIRGLRHGQYYTLADGAPYFPGRIDLDTPVAKFDPGSVANVNVVRGPYTTLAGPAHAFLLVTTYDTPRYDCDQVHGRTSVGYQTNGNRWDGVQSVWGGGANWGFRVTYNIQQGNDYRAGDGTRVPSSYLSNTVNYAFGFDLDKNNSLEFKGLRTWQDGLEFPGLYFDTQRSDTEAYALRYTMRQVGPIDTITLDTWYNTTVGRGDTLAGPKQAFTTGLLRASFNASQFKPGTLQPNGPESSLALFRDFSVTNFAERSVGYRLAGTIGDNKERPTIIAGTDLNVFGQSLNETILFQQYQGTNVVTGQPIAGSVNPVFNQEQSIPRSNAVDPGIFLQARLPIDRLTLSAGGRVDFVRTTSNPRLITGNIDIFGAPGIAQPGVIPNPFPRIEVDPAQYSTNPGGAHDLSRNFALFAGFISSEYKLTENWTSQIAFGHSQHAPTLTELYASGPFIGVLQQGTSRLIGDPALAKEKAYQIDMGLRGDYEWMTVGANAFYSWINDYITYDLNKGSTFDPRTGTFSANGTQTPPSGLTQVVFTNTGLATLAGTELYAQVNVTDWLTPFATLSYVQGFDRTHVDNRRAANVQSSRRNLPQTGDFATSTEPLPQIPPLESRLGFRIHEGKKDPRWQIEFFARVVNGQDNVATSLGEIPTAGFTTFNVRTFWKPTDWSLLTFGVENIGDKLYREHLDPIAGNLLGVGPLYRPGTNFYFTTQVSY